MTIGIHTQSYSPFARWNKAINTKIEAIQIRIRFFWEGFDFPVNFRWVNYQHFGTILAKIDHALRFVWWLTRLHFANPFACVTNFKTKILANYRFRIAIGVWFWLSFYHFFIFHFECDKMVITHKFAEYCHYIRFVRSFQYWSVFITFFRHFSVTTRKQQQRQRQQEQHSIGWDYAIVINDVCCDFFPSTQIPLKVALKTATSDSHTHQVVLNSFCFFDSSHWFGTQSCVYCFCPIFCNRCWICEWEEETNVDRLLGGHSWRLTNKIFRFNGVQAVWLSSFPFFCKLTQFRLCILLWWKNQIKIRSIWRDGSIPSRGWRPIDRRKIKARKQSANWK